MKKEPRFLALSNQTLILCAISQELTTHVDDQDHTMQGPSPKAVGQVMGKVKAASHPHDANDDRAGAIREAFVALAGQVRIHMSGRGTSHHELSRYRGIYVL